MRPPVALVTCLLLAACTTPAADREAHYAERYRAALATPERSSEDRQRDAQRRPAEVLAFVGIRPGMRVLELVAAGGWYTEVLAHVVGPQGRVVAQNPGFALRLFDGAYDRELSTRLAGGRLPNVTRRDREFDDLGLEAQGFDAVFTALNLHDLANNDPAVATAVLREAHRLLRPGGVFGIVDHNGAEGADNRRLHRMPVAQAVALAEAAGFVVVRSDLLANPQDDLSLVAFDPAIRGRTDRFVLRLVKPREG